MKKTIFLFLLIFLIGTGIYQVLAILDVNKTRRYLESITDVDITNLSSIENTITVKEKIPLYKALGQNYPSKYMYIGGNNNTYIYPLDYDYLTPTPELELGEVLTFKDMASSKLNTIINNSNPIISLRKMNGLTKEEAYRATNLALYEISCLNNESNVCSKYTTVQDMKYVTKDLRQKEINKAQALVELTKKSPTVNENLEFTVDSSSSKIVKETAEYKIIGPYNINTNNFSIDKIEITSNDSNANIELTDEEGNIITFDTVKSPIIYLKIYQNYQPFSVYLNIYYYNLACGIYENEKGNRFLLVSSIIKDNKTLLEINYKGD